jgi:phage baseplate assembly protein V
MKNLFKALSNMIERVVIDALNSGLKGQTADVRMIGDETKAGLEHLEPYGFTSAPTAGAEGLALFNSGDRTQGVIVVIADRRSRITGLEPGEVAIYTDEGDSVILKRGRIIEMTTETLNITAAKGVNIDTPLLQTTGEISDGVSTMGAMRDTFNDHDHPENGDGGGTTSPPNQQMGGANEYHRE